MKILIAECTAFPAEAQRLLAEKGEVLLADLDRDGLRQALREDVDVLWVRLRNRIDEDLLEEARALRLIATPTTGLTHLDQEALDRRGIELISLRGEAGFLKQIRATAEHTIGLMLALLRHLPASVEHVRSGGWDRDQFIGGELQGKTIGLIGYGRLGQIVARYLRAFDAHVLAADPAPDASPMADRVEWVALPELLERADIVSLHANLTAANHGLLGRAEFALMKPGALFVNTARGELVDEAALAEALESGHLAGAALDVLAGEESTGMAGHRLVQLAVRHPRLLITPHVGGATVESKEKTEIFLAAKVCAWMDAHALVRAGGQPA